MEKVNHTFEKDGISDIFLTDRKTINVDDIFTLDQYLQFHTQILAYHSFVQ